MIHHKIVAPLNYIITQKFPCTTNTVVQGAHSQKMSLLCKTEQRHFFYKISF